MSHSVDGRATDPSRARIVFACFSFLGLAALLAAAWTLRTLILMTFLALLLAVVLRSLGDLVHRLTGMRRRWAVLAVAALLALAAVGAAVWVAPTLIEQARALANRIPEAVGAVQKRIDETPGLSGVVEQVTSGLSLPSPKDAAGGAAAVIGIFASAFSYVGVALVGALFLAMEPALYRRGAIQLVPVRHRPFAEALIDELDEVILSWLGGQLVLMAFIGVMTGLGLWAIGVPYALALGVLAGLLEFIPYLGPILSAVPALLLAITAGPTVALWTLGLVVGVQQVENNILQPIVQKSAVDIPPTLLIVALFAMGLIFGVAGLLVATPLLAVLMVIVRRVYVQRILEGRSPYGEAEPAHLAEGGATALHAGAPRG